MAKSNNEINKIWLTAYLESSEFNAWMSTVKFADIDFPTLEFEEVC